MCFLLHHGYGYKLWDYEIIVSFLLDPLFLQPTNSWDQGVMQKIWFEMGCNADQVRMVFPFLHLTWYARREKWCVIMYHGFVTSEICNMGRKWRMKLVLCKNTMDQTVGRDSCAWSSNCRWREEGNALGSFKSPSRYKRNQVRLWITAQQEKLWIECTILQLLLQTNNWHQTSVNLHHPSTFSCVWNVVRFAHAGLVMCFCSCLQMPKVGTRASSQEPENSNRSNLECPTADQ